MSRDSDIPLTALVAADTEAARTGTYVALYRVRLVELIGRFDAVLELLEAAAEICGRRMFWNAAAEIGDSAANEFSVWIAHGNQYRITHVTDHIHLCPLSIYQLCTAAVSDTVLRDAMVYFETNEVPAAIKIKPDIFRASIFEYDYPAVKKYLRYATAPLEHIIHSKDKYSIMAALKNRRRRLLTFTLLFSSATLTSVAAQYYAGHSGQS